MKAAWQEVQQELKALDEIGVRVSPRAFAKCTPEKTQELHDAGMSYSEIADFYREMA